MRTIIIGDVHGCLDELQELFIKLNATAEDRIVFLGDLVDKGPDSVGVVRILCDHRTIGWNLTLLLGNHEAKHAACRKAGGGPSDIHDIVKALDAEDLAFLDSALPYLVLPEYNVLCVHAGVLPGMRTLPVTPEELKHHVPRMIRVRYVTRHSREKVLLEFELEDCADEVETFLQNPDDPCTLENFADASAKRRVVSVDSKPAGSFVKLGDEDAKRDIFWANNYDNRFGHIYFGHNPFMPGAEQPGGPGAPYFSHATGLDGGCVFGGELRAAVLEEGKGLRIVRVPAHKKYATSYYEE